MIFNASYVSLFFNVSFFNGDICNHINKKTLNDILPRDCLARARFLSSRDSEWRESQRDRGEKKKRRTCNGKLAIKTEGDERRERERMEGEACWQLVKPLSKCPKERKREKERLAIGANPPPKKDIFRLTHLIFLAFWIWLPRPDSEKTTRLIQSEFALRSRLSRGTYIKRKTLSRE